MIQHSCVFFSVKQLTLWVKIMIVSISDCHVFYCLLPTWPTDHTYLDSPVLNLTHSHLVTLSTVALMFHTSTDKRQTETGLVSRWQNTILACIMISKNCSSGFPIFIQIWISWQYSRAAFQIFLQKPVCDAIDTSSTVRHFTFRADTHRM